MSEREWNYAIFTVLLMGTMAFIVGMYGVSLIAAIGSLAMIAKVNRKFNRPK